MPGKNRRWIMVERPSDELREDHFRLEEGHIPEPKEGEMLLRSLYFSCDPSQLGWMTGAADYIEPVEVGDVMKSAVAAEVVQSNHPDFQVETWYPACWAGKTTVFQMGPTGLGPILNLFARKCLFHSQCPCSP